jgi:hypothetical protein
MAQPQQTPQQETLPATVSTLAAAVVVVYTTGEQDLISQSGQFIREALQAPVNSPPRYLLHSRLQRAAQQVSAGIRMQVAGLAQRVADTAARNGNATAAREVRRYAEKYRLSGNVLDLLPHDVNSARMIADDLSKRLDAAALRITRFADDAYKAAVASGAVAQVLDKAVPLASQAQAWRELTAKGVTGFTDKSGRNWNLASYVEMATRTATQRAYNASHRDRLTLAGITYFTISTTGRPCPLCAPWEGKILADAGAGIATEPNASNGDPVTFHVSATIEEATAAGLFHPNCKHTLTGYLPGVTVLKLNQWTPADEAAYQDTQTLRALERAVRASKQQAAGAVNDLDKRRAQARTRDLQAQIRDHANSTGLLRRPNREQPSLGYKP